MAFRRVAGAALSQFTLLACGVGLPLALRAHMFAVTAVLALTALWIAVVTSSRSDRSPASLAEGPRETGQDAVQTRLLASLLDQTPAPLVTLDEDGGLHARNRVARQLFATDDVIPAPPADLFFALQAASPVGRTTVRVRERMYAVSRGEVSMAAGPLRLAVLLDIEADLRAAEAKTLRELMQVLGHELMNGLTPVASLAATAQALLSDGGADAASQAREALAVLARRAEGLARFAEGYRSLARLPPPELAPTSLATVIEDAARLFASRWAPAGVTLAVSPPSASLVIAVDRDQLMQALLNLLSNAAEAALAGSAPPRVDLACEARDRGAVISVADSGAGVAASARDPIFQPFFTTKAGGTGVGLSLSRQIARAHGGELELRAPEPGRGAVFDLRLEG